MNFKDDFKQTYFVSKYNLKEEEDKIKDVEGEYNKAQNNFLMIINLSKD